MIAEYITGERIQELTDHTIVTFGQFFVEEQLKNTNCKYTYFDKNKNVSSLPPDVLNAKILFVYTHILDFFFHKIYPLLNNPFVLVTHNSDDGVDDRYTKYLEDDKIIAWFASNNKIEHKKITAIPIGIANSQWPHGNLALIDSIKNTNNEKTELVYKSFNVSTSAEHRRNVDRLTSLNGIKMGPPVDNRTYLTQLSKSKFCICPYGNGIDSHRVWEALYLGSIPVVPNCSFFRSFDGLPMIYVDDWSDVTPAFLSNEYVKICQNVFNYEKSNLSYWRTKIRNII